MFASKSRAELLAILAGERLEWVGNDWRRSLFHTAAIGMQVHLRRGELRSDEAEVSRPVRAAQVRGAAHDQGCPEGRGECGKAAI